VVYDTDASVLVRQKDYCAIVAMLSHECEEGAFRKYKNLRPFGMFENSYNPDEADEIMPMMIKYVYDNTTEEKTVEEFPIAEIRRNWIENWSGNANISALKASNRYAANFIKIKQRSLRLKSGVALNEQQTTLAAQMEHNRWVMEKLLVGFRAPTPEEAALIAGDREKREYYKARFVHEDIKGYHVLGEDHKAVDVKIYDINISKALPYMLK
jgi:hypothetical protein